jgi:hypothetical protein
MEYSRAHHDIEEGVGERGAFSTNCRSCYKPPLSADTLPDFSLGWRAPMIPLQ